MYVISYHSQFDTHPRVEILGGCLDEFAARRSAYLFLKNEEKAARIVRYEDVNGFLDMDTLYSYAALDTNGFVQGVVCVCEVDVLTDDDAEAVPDEEEIVLESEAD